jgi:hypothetical protein
VDGALRLISTILTEVATVETGNGRRPHRMAATACLVVAALGVVTALGCLVASLWLAVLPPTGPVMAPLACAGGVLLVSAILVAVGYGLLRRPKHVPPPAAPLVELLRQLDAARLFRDHKSDSLIAALAAGLIAGSADAIAAPPAKSR